MAVLTRIEPHPARRDACTLHLDGEPWLTLQTALLGELGLRAGEVLTAAEAAGIEREADRREALDAALRALAVRQRSRAELARHLRGKRCGADAIEAALARCEELGYLDDRAFAAAFARDRIRMRPRALARIRAELRQRGVAEADAEAGIGAAFEEEGASEADLLDRAARRRWAALAGLDPEVAERRLASYLLRRGFAPDVVWPAVRRLGGRGR